MADASSASTPESLEDMERRHKLEQRELEGKIRAMVKGAKKSQKAELDFKATQMEFDLKARQREEELELEEFTEAMTKLGGARTIFATSPEDAALAREKAEEQARKDEAERLQQLEAAEQAKMAKARAKKDKAKLAALDRERVKEEISASAGPSLRAIELEAVNKKLAQESPALRVKEIISDGNCLYRAVADQLRITAAAASAPAASAAAAPLDFADLRALAARHMRQHACDYAPFLGLEVDSDEFAAYLRSVERSTGEVEWGGQLEIRAMCEGLRRCVCVYDANAPVLVMGPEFRAEAAAAGGGDLRLAYHRHYFSLGEHYNSVEPSAGKDP